MKIRALPKNSVGDILKTLEVSIDNSKVQAKDQSGTQLSFHSTLNSIRSSANLLPAKISPNNNIKKPEGIESLTLNIMNTLNRYSSNWNSTVNQINLTQKTLPKDFREIVSIQCKMNKLNLETHLLTKVGESFNSTIKRVQQMGGG